MVNELLRSTDIEKGYSLISGVFLCLKGEVLAYEWPYIPSMLEVWEVIDKLEEETKWTSSTKRRN